MKYTNERIYLKYTVQPRFKPHGALKVSIFKRLVQNIVESNLIL